MLEYLYRSDYSFAEIKCDHPIWCFHLDVAETADNYGVDGLEDYAYTVFKAFVYSEKSTARILTILRELSIRDYKSDEMKVIIAQLRDKHFMRLLNASRFRLLLETDTDCLLKYMKRLLLLDKVKLLETFDNVSEQAKALVFDVYHTNYATLVKNPAFRKMLAADKDMILDAIGRLTFASELVNMVYWSCHGCRYHEIGEPGQLAHHYCDYCAEHEVQRVKEIWMKADI